MDLGSEPVKPAHIWTSAVNGLNLLSIPVRRTFREREGESAGKKISIHEHKLVFFGRAGSDSQVVIHR